VKNWRRIAPYFAKKKIQANVAIHWNNKPLFIFYSELLFTYAPLVRSIYMAFYFINFFIARSCVEQTNKFLITVD